jgi:anti-anti-sigma factor
MFRVRHLLSAFRSYFEGVGFPAAGDLTPANRRPQEADANVGTFLMNRDAASLDAQAGSDVRAGRTIGPPKERNEMLASSVDSDHQGVIRLVPETDEILAVSLEGAFDLANAPALGRQIDRALETGNGLIVDLSKATFIDSSVINVLVRASKAAGARGQAMVIQLGTAALVERVLELARLEQVLPRAHDRQEAVRVVQQRAKTV